MRIPEVFKDIRYVGKAEGDRKTYYVFENKDRYLVIGPTARGGYYVNAVDRECLEVITKVFKGQKVTSVQVTERARRSDLCKNSPASLNVLYAMVASRRARKLSQRAGKAMVFKIT